MHLTRDGPLPLFGSSMSGSPASEGCANDASRLALVSSPLAPLWSRIVWKTSGRAVLGTLFSAAVFFCVYNAQLHQLPSLSGVPPFLSVGGRPTVGENAAGNRASDRSPSNRTMPPGHLRGSSDQPRPVLQQAHPLVVSAERPDSRKQALGRSGRGGGKAGARDASRHYPPLGTPVSSKPVPALAYPADAQLRNLRREHVCWRKQCKFLFPGVVGEQLTKASLHFHQLALLARRLNRTLVLPNVADSRIESCLPYPFSTYFDVDALGGLVEWIEISEFVEILRDRFRTRPHGPGDLRERGHATALDRPTQHNLQHSLTTPPWITAQYLVFSVRPLPPKADRRNAQGFKPLLQCYRENTTNPTGAPANPLPFTRPTLNFFPPEYRRPGEADDARRFSVRAPRRASEAEVWGAYARSVFATLQLLAGVDVLAVHYRWRKPYLFPADAETPLDYNPAYWARARRIASTYMARPFVAVHWRMETVDPRGMPACADLLAQHLRKVKRELLEGREPAPSAASRELGPNGISVFLANDLPPNEGETVRQRATTFVNASALYYAARRKLLDAVPGITTWWSLTLEDRRRAAEEGREASDELPGEARMDTGTMGILDKLVCSLADHFVAGPPGCSKGSSFTRQIASLRAGPSRWVPSDLQGTEGSGGPGGEVDGGTPRVAGVIRPGAQAGRLAGDEMRYLPTPRSPGNVVDTWPAPTVAYVRQVAARYDVDFGANTANLDDSAEWRGGS